MKISTERAGSRARMIGAMVMACAFASMIGALGTTPAFAKDDNRGRHDGHDNHDWHADHGRYDHRPEYRPVYQPAYHHPYYRSQPVYIPPPVYYPPPPSPGLSLFLPFDIRIR